MSCPPVPELCEKNGSPSTRRPVLLINPRSGDGKAARAALADRARERGVEAVVLGATDDLATLVAIAVDKGADALGMAGGDGSLATVAAAAAEHDLPFICLPAGTRNHFALDLGIVRHDLLGALDAFTAGVERRIDMAEVNGRPFLNNISLGVYGDAVQRSGYRDAKLQTMLDTLHEVLSSTAPTPELLLTDDLARRHTSPWSCWCRTTSTHWTSRWSRVRGHGSTRPTRHHRAGPAWRQAPPGLCVERALNRDRGHRAPIRRPRRRGCHPAAASPLHNPSRRAARPHLTPPPGRLALGPAQVTITAPTRS